jgi:hypothetical protein
VQESFLRFRVGKSSGRIRPSKIIEGQRREVVTGSSRRRRKFALQVDKFRGGTLGHFAEISSRKERTVGILRGEFTNFREPLDLTEEQGRYGEYSQRFKAQEGQDRRSEPQGPSDLHVDSCISGFRGLKLRKHCNRNREIMIRDIPTAKE